ncbi:unnamed protein product [Calypogeia fissa]
MARETQAKKRTREEETTTKYPPLPPSGADATEPVEIDDSQDQDLNLSSDIKGILAALQQVRQKAVSDGQKKSEEILNNMAGEIKSLVEDTKQKVEKERQTLANAASKACKEYEKTMKDEADKYKAAFETFCNVKDSHLQTYDDIFSKFEDTKEKLLIKCEQQRKKEKIVLADLQRICAEKITAAEQLVRRKKQEEKSFNLLKKSLGCIFDSDGSNEDVDD